MILSSRAAGIRLGKGYSGKIKLMNFTVLPAQSSTVGYSWAPMWGDDYSATRNLQWLQTSKALGFNCVRVITTGIDGNDQDPRPWPSLSVFRTRCAEFTQQCRSLGLSIYPSFSAQAYDVPGADGSSFSANLPKNMAYLSVWHDVANDVLVGFDLINEINFQQPSNWSDAAVMRAQLQTMLLAARARSNLPMTFSVSPGEGALVSNAYIDMQYDLSCDFHDIHIYWDQGKAYTGPFASPASFAAMEARAKYLGSYVIGETGLNQNASPAAFATWLNNMGDIQRRPDCKGVGFWCITPQDVSAANDYGMTSDVAGALVRANPAAATAGWVSAL